LSQRGARVNGDPHFTLFAPLRYSARRLEAAKKGHRLKRIRSSACAALALLGLCAAEPGVAGVIAGSVHLAGPAPPPKKVEVTSDQYVCGTEKAAEDLLLSRQNEIGNAVVWIENAPANAAWPTPAPKVEIDQKGCVYAPHVVVVPVGGTVDFLNGDRLLHNIHATPKQNASFNRTQPKNRTIPIAFDKPEIVRVLCDLHPWMEAWVVVAPHRFYAVTGSDGRFVFDNVAPGQYRLRVWHERLGSASTQVTVADGTPAHATIEMRLP
jgi:plastocyanin